MAARGLEANYPKGRRDASPFRPLATIVFSFLLSKVFTGMQVDLYLRVKVRCDHASPTPCTTHLQTLQTRMVSAFPRDHDLPRMQVAALADQAQGSPRTTARDDQERKNTMSKHRGKGTGSIFRMRGSRYWWIGYVSEGKRRFESSESERKADAQALLTDRLGDVQKGVPVTPKLNRKTLGEGLRSVIDDQELNDRSSIDHTRRRIRLHLLKHLRADRRLSTITTADLTEYVIKRREEGASAASINQELAIAKRAFSLAIGGGELISKPKIPMLKLSNVRIGFFEEDQFEAVHAALPEELHGIVTLAYWCGWRIASEILPLQWSQIDRAKQIVRLEVGSTKNNEGRVLPYGPIAELVAVIDTAWNEHEALKTAGTICPSVFHRNGKPIRHFRKAWAAACAAAGCPSKLLHDFRRTAVRNLVRAGVPEKTAMGITGHKTRSVFDRYDIINEADLRAAMGKLAGIEPTAASPKIRKFAKR